MNDDLTWENAGMAFLSNPSPTLKPLADLLRTSEPIPQGTRDMLAQMMDPDAEPYLYFKLELKNTETARNNHLLDLRKFEIVTQYEKHRSLGLPIEKAAGEVSNKFDIDEKTVGRYRKRVEKLRNWLKGGNKQT